MPDLRTTTGNITESSVAVPDSDPSDPYVLGLHAKIVRKTLIPTVL